MFLGIRDHIEVPAAVCAVLGTLRGTVDRMVSANFLLRGDQTTGVATGFTDCFSQRGEILIIFREDVVDAQHLPTEGRGDALGMVLAEIPAVRFRSGGERTYDGS